jgi:hypothetical protein
MIKAMTAVAAVAKVAILAPLHHQTQVLLQISNIISVKLKTYVILQTRVRHILDIKNHLRTAIQKSDNIPNIDMVMIRIQALELVQGKIQD